MSNWNDFLVHQGAGIDEHGIADFKPSEFNADDTYLMPLSHQGLIEIKGPDAVKFLQGQVTCDIRELVNNHTLLGAQCNIKGRMLLCFRALQADSERILLRVDRSLIASGLASLGKYSIFFKATLTDVSEDHISIGIAGPSASAVIKDVFGIAISGDNQAQLIDKHHIIRITANQYECWLTSNDAKTVWRNIANTTKVAGQNVWTLLNIQSGIGDITHETVETFTPQAINFQLVNGINFRKGCYTGQEIVARLHYRGTLKRHMYRFEFALNNNALPRPGTTLTNSEGKSVGEIVIAAQKNNTLGELLASVVDDEKTDIYLANNPQKLNPLPLPYAIPISNEVD